ncbi:FkbM family methyltransferase [Algoriphagus sp. D3-2-R+10]|uniref:FkbM family methyltransferase n=1 Tax=Algoriphagus aurantiacus TaxID=3103948 RepID=UPI002B3A8BAA|nr:FkbM family methyltransferase [Algoriphagus sp. D3-2-R+10]MEB2776892.1 FkbM family methyltransferase [Algoriphagus sp. D3-2-R+10]
MIKHKVKSTFKTFWKNLRFNLSANDHPVFTLYYKHLYKPKKGSLSEFLSAYSLSKLGNFYVIQVGANDGITHDPIHKFIKRDHWKGVLLEPQPKVFTTELSKIYQHDKGIHPICAAIGSEDGSQKLYKVAFSESRWATGLASFSLDKIELAFKNGVVEKNCIKEGIQIPENPKDRISYNEVSVISPDTLIKKYQISKIDLLQIDAEGYDLEVIKIFDIAKTQPEAIIFENENLNPKDLKSCYNMLTENGYQLAKFGRDTLALKEGKSQFQKFFITPN